MFFPASFLQELRDRLRVSEVVGRSVQLKRKTADEYSGLCPFHQEKTPSFTVSDRKGFYHCFGCGAHGDVLRFVTEHTGKPFKDAVEELAQLVSLPLPKRDPVMQEKEEKRASLYDVCEAACAWFEAQLQRSDAEYVRDYLKRRVVTNETCALFRLGYSPPDKQALFQHLSRQGYSRVMMEEAGLIVGDNKPVDRFYHRLIFPITNSKGQVVAFGGRTMGDHPAKYLNSPDTPLFDKGRQLYATFQAKDSAYKQKKVIVAEGYMDVIALYQGGFPYAVAPLGTAVTETQLALLWKMVDCPSFCMDGDKAGQQAMLRTAERALPLLQPGKSLEYVLLPEGKDPDDLIKQEGKAAIQSLLDRAQSLSQFLWQRVFVAAPKDTPELQAKAKKDMLAHYHQIQDQAVQKAYIDDFYRRLRDQHTQHTPAYTTPSKHNAHFALPPALSDVDQTIADILRLIRHRPTVFYPQLDIFDAFSRLETEAPAMQALLDETINQWEAQTIAPTPALGLPDTEDEHLLLLLWRYYHTRYLAAAHMHLLQQAMQRKASAEKLEAIQNEQQRLNRLAQTLRNEYEDAID